jgi:hypothetical protein
MRPAPGSGRVVDANAARGQARRRTRLAGGPGWPAGRRIRPGSMAADRLQTVPVEIRLDAAGTRVHDHASGVGELR